MIGLVDYDISHFSSSKFIIPNLEIMKLATYYKTEENRFCRLLSLDEEDLSGYEKIYFFSEGHAVPKVPEQFLRSPVVEYGGTAFTNGKYIPFKNSLIDFTIPRPAIYKEYLKEKYDDGIKAKVISNVLDNSYYRCYAGEEKLPIPPVMSNKRLIMYDREFFYPNWRDILEDISNRKPSSIVRIHPIICKKLSEFFEIRNYPKLTRSNAIIFDLDIPLDEVYYMTNKYKNYLKADITPYSNVYIQLGGNFATSFQYFKDMIYKINLLYCLWSVDIPIKILYEPPFIGYKNPLANLSVRIERWADVTRKDNYSIILNDRINTKKKNPAMDERELLLKFYPSAKDLFIQSHEMIAKGGRWRI